MKAFIIVALCMLGLLSHTEAQGGRAFPVAAENYIIESFQQINFQIEYDPTNFLVDLSGNYANCANLNRRGFVSVDRRTPEGVTIQAIVDSVRGSESHVNAVVGYIRTVVNDWVRNPDYINQIRRADRFGCSVRPGCSGSVSVACLFSPSAGGGEPPSNIESGEQRALAFTPEQYALAETITGSKWDRSHFLENLSGFETDCAMIETSSWPFAKATEMAEERKFHASGLYDYAPNYDSTEDAMVEILLGFKKLRQAIEVGCSVIPDCMGGRGDIREMFVVVACVYRE